MAKRRKSRSRKRGVQYWRGLYLSFWLLWCLSGSILFSFGLLAYLNGDGKLMPVIIGGVMTILAILLGKYTTETALAMYMRKGL